MRPPLLGLIVLSCWLRAAALQAAVARRVSVSPRRPTCICCTLADQQDLFAIVGVSANADTAEIRRAFHQQARRLHPDTNPGPGSEREFQRLVDAFETLTDPGKRQQWEHATKRRPVATGHWEPTWGAWGVGRGPSATDGHPPSRGVGRGPSAPDGHPPSTHPNSPPEHAWESRPTPAADATIPVPGNSLRTWSFRSLSVERVQVFLSTEGRPLDADIELWHGPDAPPYKMRIYGDNGQLRPFRAVIETPTGPNTVAVRNNKEHLDDPCDPPLAAKVLSRDVESPSAACTASSTTIQGGALRKFHLDASIDSVEVYLQAHNRPLHVNIELLQGESHKTVIELYSENGQERPFFCVLETPGADNAVRIVNVADVDFPISASVAPLAINPDMPSDNVLVDADNADALQAEVDAVAHAAPSVVDAVAFDFETDVDADAGAINANTDGISQAAPASSASASASRKSADGVAVEATDKGVAPPPPSPLVPPPEDVRSWFDDMIGENNAPTRTSTSIGTGTITGPGKKKDTAAAKAVARVAKATTAPTPQAEAAMFDDDSYGNYADDAYGNYVDSDAHTPAVDRRWEQLSEPERAAASSLGFSEMLWDTDAAARRRRARRAPLGRRVRIDVPREAAVWGERSYR